MKNYWQRIIISILVVTPIIAKSQIFLPDSLLGSYSGERWYRDYAVCEDCWDKSIDSVTINKIDTNYCATWILGNIVPITNNVVLDFFCEYSFCQNKPSGGYQWCRFYSNDSIEIYIWKISMPPEIDSHTYGFHFWGKRTSSNHTSSSEVETHKNRINIEILGKEIKILNQDLNQGNFILSDCLGRILLNTKIKDRITIVNVPLTGIVIYSYYNQKGNIQTGKLIIKQ